MTDIQLNQNLDQGQQLAQIKDNYDEKYGFSVSEKDYAFKSQKGLTREIVGQISEMKGEPEWMRTFRLKSYDMFLKKPMPNWGGDMSGIDFDNIYYYVKASDRNSQSWDDVPEDIKYTFDRLGIPEAEQKFLAGTGAQFESEVIYHSIRKDLEEKGVIFTDTDSALKNYPDLFKEYFGTIIPPTDNKFAALNSAVWSGGSFIYVPKGVNIEMPLQAYFRINTQNMGQFERTLIIVDEGAQVHYVEGCFPAGEQVSTGSTYVNIEAVCPGDTMLDSDGNQALVKNVRTLPFNGNLIEVRPLSAGNTFKLTPEHPVLAVKRESVRTKRAQRKLNWKPEVNSELLMTTQPEFIPAGQLEAGDFIVFPISKITTPNSIFNASNLRLLGYYLAEGSAYVHKQLKQSVVTFTFNENERDLIDEVKALITEFTGKRAIETAMPSRHAVNVIVYSSDLMQFCHTHAGSDAANKQLSKQVMELPPTLQAELLATYLHGDGSVYIRKNGTTVQRAATVSRKLAFQLQKIIARQGHFASISIRKGGKDTIQGREITRKDQYIIYYSPDKGMSEVRRVGNNFLVPIKAINHVPYHGPVFNFELTSAPNAYVASGFSVHNCTAPTYSSDSLHSAVVEIIVKKNARARYTTIQNWSPNVYNLVTKRAVAYQDATMEWVDANIGCLAEGSTVTTPQGVRAIESLNPGDQVLSYDDKSGEFVFRNVVAKKFSGNQPVHVVSAGERKLTVTANHPFYSYTTDSDVSRLGYVRADHLQHAIVPAMTNAVATNAANTATVNGTRVRDARAALLNLPESVEIVKVEVSDASTEAVPTWDIEVEGTGNFVSQGFIVHNSKLTMKYPAVYLMDNGAHGEVLSVAFAGKGQHQDAGAKIVHNAPNTTSQVISKSISMHGGRASYRGLLKVDENANGSRSNVVCDALLMDEQSRTDTYPSIEIDAKDVTIGHEASVSKVGEDMLFYLMSRGITEEQANAMVVSGFIEPIAKELPAEYSIELYRLIQLQMEGSVG